MEGLTACCKVLFLCTMDCGKYGRAHSLLQGTVPVVCCEMSDETREINSLATKGM
jgi:hypothetical protein